MRETLRVLLIEDHPEAAALVQRMVAVAESPAIPIEWVDTLAKALARLETESFDAVLVDLNLPDSRGLDTLSKLRDHTRGAAIIVLTASEDEELAFASLRQGADEYLVKGDVGAAALVRRLRFAVERHQARTEPVPAGTQPVILGFFGVKGGTGTTTVALNAAAALAKMNRRTIAVELKPDFGAFSFQLKHAPATNLSSLWALGAERIDAAAISERLCSFPHGLRVLFGPQRPEEFGYIDPSAAAALMKTLPGMAERVVIDLPSLASPAAQTVIRQANFIALVLERDPMSVAAANVCLQALHSWGITQLVTGAILVNRVMSYTPMPLADIAAQLRCGVLGVVPPAIDLCARANQAGSPVVLLEPESTFSSLLTELTTRYLDQPSARAARPPVE
jgi:DNA-binding response OmpR family regulator